MALEKIRNYSQQAQLLHDDTVDFNASDTEARLADTVRELQTRIQEQQAALDKVRVRDESPL
jgi:phage shock protein A